MLMKYIIVFAIWFIALVGALILLHYRSFEEDDK